MTTPRRSVGGAARGPISLSDSSSLSVSAPFSDTTDIWRLRSMLRSRDSTVDAYKKWQTWWKDSDRDYCQRTDTERRLIRERIKQLAWLKKQEKQ